MKPDSEAIADVIIKVQRQMGYQVDFSDLFVLIQATVEKVKRIGKGIEDVPKTLEIDLRDYIYRSRRLSGKENVRCVASAAEILV